MKKTKYKRRTKNKRNYYMIFLVLTVFLVMGFQMIRLHGRWKDYEKQEAVLEQQLQGEEQRKLDLEEYEKYTQTDEYIRNTARTKLGLVGDNEIIFKEK